MSEIVYVLFNAGMPTLTRVGVLADRGSPPELMKELYSVLRWPGKGKSSIKKQTRVCP
jgi:hypothetical protein